MKPEHITAWALDELPPAESAALEDALQENPQSLNEARDTRAFCDLLTRELRDDSLALAPDQRSQLECLSEDGGMGHPACAGQAARLSPMQNGRVTLAQSKPHHGWSRHGITGLAAAACVALLAWMGMKQEMGTRTLGEDGKDKEPPVEPNAATVTVTPGKPQPEIRQKVNEKKRDGLVLTSPVRTDAESSSLVQAADFPSLPPAQPSFGKTPLSVPLERGAFGGGSPPMPAAAPAGPTPLFAFKNGSGTLNDTRDAVLPRTNTAAGEGEKKAADSFSNLNAPADEARAFRRADNSNESYTRIIENSLLEVQREPLSTFSIDVDTASYANVRRFLNQNTRPPADAVRIEELVNYFPAQEEGPPPGAEHPFGVKVEISSCPWQPRHRLARVHLQARDIGRERPASNLVFLVDVSGSMSSDDKLPLVRRSLQMLAERLGENDRVSMVTYAGGTQVVLPSVNGLQKADIIAAIDRLQSGGSTHGSAGIRLAYEQAVAGFIQGGVNRVILCTDGDFNVGISDPAELEGFITEKARSGVFLSVLGFGTGNLQDRTMETLADKGNGNYAYVDSLGEARKVLVEQMNGTLVTVAKDVKIQIEFNPAVVRQYRLIGYENRLLAKEDFNDDTKDAGEIGAGHNVTALYELVPASLPPGEPARPLVDALRYQRQIASPPALAATPAAASGEAITVKLRYKEPDGGTSRLLEVPVRDTGADLRAAGGELQFSAAVAGFGLLLRGSSYAGQLTWEQVRELALKGKGADPLGYRGEFIQLIEKARGLSRSEERPP